MEAIFEFAMLSRRVRETPGPPAEGSPSGPASLSACQPPESAAGGSMCPPRVSGSALYHSSLGVSSADAGAGFPPEDQRILRRVRVVPRPAAALAKPEALVERNGRRVRRAHLQRAALRARGLAARAARARAARDATPRRRQSRQHREVVDVQLVEDQPAPRSTRSPSGCGPRRGTRRRGRRPSSGPPTRTSPASSGSRTTPRPPRARRRGRARAHDLEARGPAAVGHAPVAAVAAPPSPRGGAVARHLGVGAPDVQRHHRVRRTGQPPLDGTRAEGGHDARQRRGIEEPHAAARACRRPGLGGRWPRCRRPTRGLRRRARASEARLVGRGRPAGPPVSAARPARRPCVAASNNCVNTSPRRASIQAATRPTRVRAGSGHTAPPGRRGPRHRRAGGWLAKASPCAVAMPTRSPVSEPGPRPTTNRSMCDSDQPGVGERREHGRRAGTRRTAAVVLHRHAATPRTRRCHRARLPGGEVVSRASTRMWEDRLASECNPDPPRVLVYSPLSCRCAPRRFAPSRPRGPLPCSRCRSPPFPPAASVTPAMRQYPRREAPVSRRDRVLPDGRLLRDVLRGRAGGGARPRPHADLAIQGRLGGGHPDVRGAPPRGRRLPRAAGAEGIPRRHLRAGRGSAQGQGARAARGRARRVAGNPHRHELPGRQGARVPDVPRGAGRAPPGPGSQGRGRHAAGRHGTDRRHDRRVQRRRVRRRDRAAGARRGTARAAAPRAGGLRRPRPRAVAAADAGARTCP